MTTHKKHTTTQTACVRSCNTAAAAAEKHAGIAALHANTAKDAALRTTRHELHAREGAAHATAANTCAQAAARRATNAALLCAALTLINATLFAIIITHAL